MVLVVECQIALSKLVCVRLAGDNSELVSGVGVCRNGRDCKVGVCPFSTVKPLGTANPNVTLLITTFDGFSIVSETTML